jgi:ankyrin repeat protein
MSYSLERILLFFAALYMKELRANVNGGRLRDGATPLYAAAQLGSLAVVRCLVKELGADVNQALPNGAMPLFMAAQTGNLDLVRSLVKELGADINQARQNGTTPLVIAVKYNRLAVVHCLAEDLGASVARAGEDGVTPLFMAAQMGYLVEPRRRRLASYVIKANRPLMIEVH